MKRTLIIKLQMILTMSLIWSLNSCKTQDVYPTISLGVETEKLNADGASTYIYAYWNVPVSYNISVPLTLSGNSVLGTDYTLSANSITITAGNDTGKITLTSISNSDTSTRNIIASIGEVENAIKTIFTSVKIELINVNIDRDGDGVPDILDDCPDEAGPLENNGCPWLGLLINEVHYDPASDITGDANGDGVRDPLADEFVELYNSNPDLDISGYTLSDASQVRHTFPQGTKLASKKSMVVFGGGTPIGTFGGALIQTASEGQLNLNNAGDLLTLKDAQGNKIAEFDINGLSGNPDESYTRNPDIKGDFKQHSTIPESNGALFSPGTQLNGNPF